MGKVITDQLDFFKGRPIKPENIVLHEMVSAADYTLVTAMIRQWDLNRYKKALEELRTEYEDVIVYDNRIFKEIHGARISRYVQKSWKDTI